MKDLLYDLFLMDAKAEGHACPEIEAKRKLNECEAHCAEREAVFNNTAPRNSDVARRNASAAFVNEMTNKCDSIICRSTKSDLNRYIRWSSSRYNQWKKSDFIDKIITLSKANVTHYDSGEVVAGSYGAGSVGHGNAFGTSNYSTRGTGGSYRLISLDGFIYVFLLESTQVILLEGACYPTIQEIRADGNHIN